MKETALLAILVASLASSPWASADTKALPETMSAAALDHGGGPEVLTMHRVPVPKPAAGEVLIAVHATGIAVWDADFRQHPGDRAHFPLILGEDGAGTVAAIGPGVQDFKLGDEVYGTGFGFYAEYARARAKNVAHIPRGIGFDEAGLLPISGLSAIQGIDDVLQLKPGETLIVHGAAGAVGTLAVQFAKLRGAKVLATASSDEEFTSLRRLGADAVVNGRTGDIAAAAKRFAPSGVDAVLGLAGGEALERCLDAVRRDGRGRAAYLYGVEPAPKPRATLRMTAYSFVPGIDEFDRLNKAVEAARLQVPIAARYPLAAAAEAHKRLQAGHLFGKIVLVVH